jgi:hypothetical protein
VQEKMLKHLSRFTTLISVRNFGVSKNIYASTSVLVENKEKDGSNVVEAAKNQNAKKGRKSN